ncbi:MAG: NAD(P)-dependent glycerol-3-phosphate dehydrogenase [Kiritimatiellae bacterium]|nr:NAD(P)-dependent glycerol-3-phosphate dehydrogenase [Kiritimatiellia bacterium]
MQRITILGDGGWGTALGLLMHKQGHAVRLWGPFPEYVARLQRERENKLFLPGVPLPESMHWTSDRDEAVAGADVVILASPSKFYRSVLESFAGRLPKDCALLSVSKGLDAATRRRLAEVAGEVLGHKPVAVLSGPSLAGEVARGVPTAVVIACADHLRAHALQKVMISPQFRIYTSEDVVGVELGGALKNIMAIATGASDGLGFGDNTRAALITRGLAEMTRLGVALGARPETFAGLSGLGDLIVTCTSRSSRNHQVGERLGRGETLDQIVGSMSQVAEGVTTCAIARALAREHGVRTPITDEVHAVLHEGRSPALAVETLMTRDARPERD